jgi:hypothetical protein
MHLDPPGRALVLCVEEKSQIHAHWRIVAQPGGALVRRSPRSISSVSFFWVPTYETPADRALADAAHCDLLGQRLQSSRVTPHFQKPDIRMQLVLRHYTGAGSIYGNPGLSDFSVEAAHRERPPLRAAMRKS